MRYLHPYNLNCHDPTILQREKAKNTHVPDISYHAWQQQNEIEGVMVDDLQSGSCANKKKRKQGVVRDTVGSTVLAESRGDGHAQTAGHLALCGGGVSQGQQVGQLGFGLGE